MGLNSCVVRMENIETRFGDVVVHRDISLCLHAGERMALVGGSGSGKTTLLREMAGLIQPSSGRVEMFGHDLARVDSEIMESLRDRYGVLFQAGALFTDLTVFENVAVPLREIGLKDTELLTELVCTKIRMVGLDMRDAGLKPAQLSGGMIKRTALARALALEPELLFLDEPTSGLDPLSAQKFVDLLRALHRDLGFSMVMITHDLHILRDLSDRVAVLADAELVTLGDLDEVRRCDHPFVQGFFHGRRADRVFEGRLAHG